MSIKDSSKRGVMKLLLDGERVSNDGGLTWLILNEEGNLVDQDGKEAALSKGNYLPIREKEVRFRRDILISFEKDNAVIISQKKKDFPKNLLDHPELMNAILIPVSIDVLIDGTTKRMIGDADDDQDDDTDPDVKSEPEKKNKK